MIVDALSNDYFIFASFLTTIFFGKNVMTMLQELDRKAFIP